MQALNWLSEADRRLMWARWKRGDTVADIARTLRRRDNRVHEWLTKSGGIEPPRRKRSERALSLSEREEISRGLAANHSLRAIARSLNRSPSTISREVKRNGGAEAYRAERADSNAYRKARRPKQCHLAENPRLAYLVACKLRRRWSPQQISCWLRKRYAQDKRMTVSHETIYRTLYVQTRGALKKELQGFLRKHHAIRRSRHSTAKGGTKGQLHDMVLISERPPEVEDRAVPGHWEGDLVFGSNGSVIATLVERHSRFLMLLKVGSRDTQTVVEALTKSVKRLPAGLMYSLTWDRGKELARHKLFTIDTGVQVYFCDPRSPWQRGSNENTNGLLRQYFPKTMDLSKVSQAQLTRVAREMNTRPRKTLDYETPADTLARAVALIA